jgi:hypothetical protein
VAGIAATIADTSLETSSSAAEIRRLRPPSGQTNTTGRFPVSSWSDRTLFPSFFRAVTAAMAGRCRCLGAGRAGLYPSRPDQRGLLVGLGPPQSADLGHSNPVQKGISESVLFQKNVRTCKTHSNLSVYQKNAYDLPKCSEKHALHVYVKFMHGYTTLTPA